MKSDELYKHLEFTNEFSVDDWNDLISIKIRPYFRNDNIFNSNKEVLRTEIINYIKFSEKPEKPPSLLPQGNLKYLKYLK